MTKEKAIECLTLLKVFDAPVLAEAVKMAVIALRTQADTPPNDPLTLEELREMDGEPVWMSTRRLSEWCIVHSFHSDDVIGGGIIVTRRTAEKRTCSYADHGKTWLAYRRRPEEGGSVGH